MNNMQDDASITTLPLPLAAERYRSAGLCVLPAHYPAKRPALPSWTEFQGRLPTEMEVKGWFEKPQDACCIVTGSVSGNAEIIDYDGKGVLYEPWRHLVADQMPGLLDRLVIERTPSDGFHVVYRCATPVDGNAKLAQRREAVANGDGVERYGKDITPRKGIDGAYHIDMTLIKTRGEGGLFLCAPSPGYRLIQGDLASPPILTADERDVLLQAARALNEILPQPIDAPARLHPTEAGDRPGDDYNRRGDVQAELRQHGWTMIRDGINQLWRRPGKPHGISATLKGGCFYVFTSNGAPFENPPCL